MSQKNIPGRMNDFKSRLDDLQQKLVKGDPALNRSGQQDFEEIQTLVEELSVALEELQTQNDELLISRHTVEVERERYKELFDFAPDGYLVTDKFGNIREANQAAGVLLNVSPMHLIGKPLTIYVTKDDLPQFRTFLTRLESEPGAGGQQFECSFQPRDGEAFPASLTAAPALAEAQGEDGTYSLRWMLRDISERRRMMDQLQTSNEALEGRVAERTAELVHMNKELQDFAFIASHDMKEPLRKIQAFADLIQENYGSLLPEEGRGFLDRLLRATDRMDEMLQGLLNYSRVTTRNKPFQPTDLGQVFDGVMFDLELMIEDQHACIKIQPLPSIEADPDQMRQLFQNLLTNALKFHEPDLPPQVEIWAEEAGLGQVKLLIKDNGIGINEEFYPKIFEPFRRLNPRSSYGGTGMGLAICKKIVERHHGHLSVESEPGKGSTFTVTLPVKRPEPVE